MGANNVKEKKMCATGRHSRTAPHRAHVSMATRRRGTCCYTHRKRSLQCQQKMKRSPTWYLFDFLFHTIFCIYGFLMNSTVVQKQCGGTRWHDRTPVPAVWLSSAPTVLDTQLRPRVDCGWRLSGPAPFNDQPAALAIKGSLPTPQPWKATTSTLK